MAVTQSDTARAWHWSTLKQKTPARTLKFYLSKPAHLAYSRTVSCIHIFRLNFERISYLFHSCYITLSHNYPRLYHPNNIPEKSINRILLSTSATVFHAKKNTVHLSTEWIYGYSMTLSMTVSLNNLAEWSLHWRQRVFCVVETFLELRIIGCLDFVLHSVF
jgi:hypothetical protein